MTRNPLTEARKAYLAASAAATAHPALDTIEAASRARGRYESTLADYRRHRRTNA